MGKKPEGLAQRGKVYQVRIHVPDNIQLIIGKTEYYKSLHTRNHDEALERFWPIKAEIERVFASARRQSKSCEPHTLSESAAEYMGMIWVCDLLHRVQEEAIRSLGVGELSCCGHHWPMAGWQNHAGASYFRKLQFHLSGFGIES